MKKLRIIWCLFVIGLTGYYLTEAINQQSPMTSIKYSFVYLYFWATGIFIVWMWRKFTRGWISSKYIILLCLVFSTFFCYVTAQVFLPPSPSLSTIVIRSVEERNSESSASEIWLVDVYKDNKQLDLSNIALSEGWVYNAEYNDIVFYPGISEKPGELIFEISYRKNLRLEFGKSSFSGMVEYMVDDITEKEDLYISDGGKFSRTFEAEKQGISVGGVARTLGCILLMSSIMQGILSIIIYKTKQPFSLRRIICAPWSFALMQWMVSIKTDGLFFKLDLYNSTYFYAKLAFLCVLLVAWYGIFHFYAKVKAKNIFYQRWLKYILIYFLIVMILIVIVYPGNWIWDDMFILEDAQNFSMNYWQHYITSIYYIFSIMILPFTAGIIIVQNMLISVIVGYIISNVTKRIDCTKLVWLLFVPFLLPPMLWHHMYPLRLTLYSYLEVLLIFMLIELCITDENISIRKVLFTGILTAVVAVWRSEAIYYAVMAPLFVLLCLYNRRKVIVNYKKLFVLYSASVIAFSIGLYIPQQRGISQINKAGNINYSVSGIIDQIRGLVLVSDPVQDCTNLNSINKVMDIDKLVKYKNGEEAFWSGKVIRKNFDDNQYSQMKGAYLALAVKYPIAFLKNRWDMFANTSWWPKEDHIRGGTKAVDIAKENTTAHSSFREKYLKNSIPFPQARIFTLRFLEGRDSKTSTFIIGATWNLLLPFSLLIFVMLVILIRKQWKIFLLLSLCAVKIPIVFITAPTTYFMYYLPTYLLSNVVTVVAFCKLVNDCSRRRKNHIGQNY